MPAASWDAVNKICQTAYAHTIRSPVAVVAEDSDVFKLLVHHADPVASNLYLVAANGTISATTIKRRVDVQLSKSLLFLHAISVYDRTSRPHAIRKVKVLKKYATLAESTATFMARKTSKVALEKAVKIKGMEATQMIWKLQGSRSFKRKWPQQLDTYHQRSFRRHQTPPEFTVAESFSRYKWSKVILLVSPLGAFQD